VDQYQIDSRLTWKDVETGITFDDYCLLGLASEVGELLGIVKKVYRDRNGEASPEIREKIKLELGDILWYLTQVATSTGFSLQEIADANTSKLVDRRSRGAIGGDGDYR